jgi:hypothetical protein
MLNPVVNNLIVDVYLKKCMLVYELIDIFMYPILQDVCKGKLYKNR